MKSPVYGEPDRTLLLLLKLRLMRSRTAPKFETCDLIIKPI